jgi:signal transduction histidine kinase
MLDKTVTALKADKAKTLDEINAGTNGFLVGDIYPFCFQLSDGKNVAVANPNAKALIGKDVRTLKDPTGEPYGQRIYDAAKEGQVNTVGNYKFPKPGADKTPVPKEAFVTAVVGLGCGVGYYK